MRRLREAFLDFAADTLRRGVGRDEVGVFPFKALELVHARVVLRVRPLGAVEDVIEVLMVAEFVAQRFDLLLRRGGLCFGRGHSLRNYMQSTRAGADSR